VINHVTQCILSTAARTRIATLLIDTRRNTRTLRIDGALGPTVGGRPHVILETRAGGTLASDLTDRIRTARTRFARPDGFPRDDRSAPGERIAAHAFGATADGVVVDDLTSGVDAARSRARIHAFVVETGLG
jgi:hypothetical protein